MLQYILVPMDAYVDILVVAQTGGLPSPFRVVHEDVIDEQCLVGPVSLHQTIVVVAAVVRGEEVISVVFVVGVALQVHVTLHQMLCRLHISGQNQSLRGDVVAVVIFLVRVRPDEQHDRPWRFRVLGDGPQVANVQGLLRQFSR